MILIENNINAQTIVESGTSKLFYLDSKGKLVYTKDKKGNRLPDFSLVGYHYGEKAIPDVPVKITLSSSEGDDTERIQEALDKLGRLHLNKSGYRGALLLKAGTYRVGGTLRIKQSGIVLMGEGNGAEGTLIIATGYNQKKYKRALITVGNNNRVKLDEKSRQKITDDYVPIGAQSFNIESTSGYRVGDRIIVQRPATKEWITLIGCDKLKSKWGKDKDGKKVDQTKQWTPKDYTLNFERRITAIKGKQITIDAPIVQSMDKNFGGGLIFKYEAPDRVTEVGIENLRIFSEFAPPTKGNPYGDPKQTTKSENHGWHGIKLSRNTENTWVKNVIGKYFGWSLVSASGKLATVQDCANLGHASQITGGRRYPFMIDGQLNLVQRCMAVEGRHEFVNQARTSGPNVFVDCAGFKSKSSAGPHHRYAVGNLYDNVKSENMMESRFRGNSGTGHGWAGSQTCFYNCIAKKFSVQAPPGGISWIIGSGKADKKEIRVKPASLYYQQVQDRLGISALDRLSTPKQRKNLGTYQWAQDILTKEKSERRK